jgi:pimeloyl-ACP methyl ester carboxylesterase
MLLMHGWPQHWYMWREVIPLVAPHARVIAPDFRGFGWSDVPRGGYESPRVRAADRGAQVGRLQRTW